MFQGEDERGGDTARRTIEFATAVSDGSSCPLSYFPGVPRRPAAPASPFPVNRPSSTPFLRAFSTARFSTPCPSSSTPSRRCRLFPGTIEGREGGWGHYVQLQEAFSRSNSVCRSFDHDPEERLGSIGNVAAPASR